MSRWHRGRSGLLAMSWVVAMSSWGCSPSSVIVATAEDLSVEGGAGQICSSGSGCLEQAYCSKRACDDTEGACALAPFECDNTYDPVCGCDGVIYWNDCLRQRDGISSSVPGQCTGGAPFSICGGPGRVLCPSPDAVCSNLARGPGDGCEPPRNGLCWVLPDNCPSDAGPSTWRSCGGGPPTCKDFCAAILSGDVYVDDGMCTFPKPP
jgi:hypothetical protein